MKIIFLNVWGGTRKDELIEFIRLHAQNTDVFCFQEATGGMKDLCKEILADYKEITDYKFIGEDDNFPQAMFIKKSREIISHGTLLPHDMDAGLAIYAEIKTEEGSLYICNVHGIAQPGDKLDSPGRLKQSRALMKFFEDIEQPVVIGGDFNISPDTESIKMFQAGGYRDLVQDCHIDTTRNHFAWDRFPDNKQYYSDYVFLNSMVEYKGFAVPKIDVSDHLPLILEIRANEA